MRPPLLHRIGPRAWVAVDCAAAVLIALVYLVVWRDLAPMPGPRWIDLLAMVFTVVPAGFRRIRPRAVLATVLSGQILLVLMGATAQPALAVAFVIYLIPLRAPRREALRALIWTLLVIVATELPRARIPFNTPAPLVINVLVVAVAWMIGDSVRHQRAYAAEQRSRAERRALRELAEQRSLAERRAREELAEARRATMRERLRIARELHDVVAHSMSLIAVQAGVANYVVGSHPDEAPRALGSIEETARGALREMRTLLGVLRAETDDGLVPTPGLADLASLVERTADAGLRVDLALDGEPVVLSVGLDLAVYRVIQESVTNVIKHAGTDRCRVLVRYRPDTLTVRVTDDGTGPAAPGLVASGPAVPGVAVSGAGVGHGVVGMRERVSAYGGSFSAGSGSAGGFRVEAVFPLTAVTAAPIEREAHGSTFASSGGAA